MAKTIVTSESYSVTGDGFVGTLYTDAITNVAGTPPGSFTLAVGFNSIPVPSTATAVTIVPPNTSTVTKTLKGVLVTVDQGTPFGPATSIKLSFTAALASTIGITSNGVETLTLLWG